MAVLGACFFCLFPTISLQIISFPLFTFPEDSPALSQPSCLLHLITCAQSMHFYLHQVKFSVNSEQYHQLTVILSVPLVLSKHVDSASSEEGEESHH